MNEKELNYLAQYHPSIFWLRFFGVLIIICSFIAGIIVWSKFGVVSRESYFSSSSEINAVGIGAAIGLMLQGLCLCVLFFGVARAVENSARVLYNLVEKDTIEEEIPELLPGAEQPSQPSDIAG